MCREYGLEDSQRRVTKGWYPCVCVRGRWEDEKRFREGRSLASMPLCFSHAVPSAWNALAQTFTKLILHPWLLLMYLLPPRRGRP